MQNFLTISSRMYCKHNLHFFMICRWIDRLRHVINSRDIQQIADDIIGARLPVSFIKRHPDRDLTAFIDISLHRAREAISRHTEVPLSINGFGHFVLTWWRHSNVKIRTKKAVYFLSSSMPLCTRCYVNCYVLMRVSDVGAFIPCVIFCNVGDGTLSFKLYTVGQNT